MSNVVCIFAHPDDESMGPGGTIARLAQKNEVYILCVTDGEGRGRNKKSGQEISTIRKAEVIRSARILGVKKVIFLGFKDGDLSNNLYHKIAGQAKKYLDKIKPTTLLTFEMRGISGHIDHIVVSMVCSYLFEKLPYIEKIMYYGITDKMRSLIDDYFIYFPPGFKENEIDEVVKLDDVWNKKIEAMCCHESQKEDVEYLLDLYKKAPKEECFMIRVKPNLSWVK